MSGSLANIQVLIVDDSKHIRRLVATMLQSYGCNSLIETKTAQQALDAGLVDRIGFLEDAVKRAVELAGLTESTARVVRYSRPRGLLDGLLDGGLAARSRGPETTLLEAFAEWTTPRAWYICSWWPPLVAGR